MLWAQSSPRSSKQPPPSMRGRSSLCLQCRPSSPWDVCQSVWTAPQVRVHHNRGGHGPAWLQSGLRTPGFSDSDHSGTARSDLARLGSSCGEGLPRSNRFMLFCRWKPSGTQTMPLTPVRPDLCSRGSPVSLSAAPVSQCSRVSYLARSHKARALDSVRKVDWDSRGVRWGRQTTALGPSPAPLLPWASFS